MGIEARSASVAIMTEDMAAQRAFYDRHFDTWYPFDSGWYVTVSLGTARSAPVISFMENREKQAKPGGVMLNILVDDVDDLHTRMEAAGEHITGALTSNPWGDRGFAVIDPAGATLYCYQEIPPSPEFAPFFHQRP